MQEKKLNDDEIVKALECCKQKGGKDTCKYCYTCPASVWDFEDGITECNVDLFQKAINLIHRLQSDLETCSNIEKQEKETNAELRQEIERLTEELKNLDWYKMWHKKFQKKIEDLTTELETYRPTKLSGHGQCKCGVCGAVSWTDWFSRYKGQTLCDKCLKEIVATEEKQAVKDTAKEILAKAPTETNADERFIHWLRERYGVEVE